MTRIEREPWAAMLAHAVQTYPEECCGAMLGRIDEGVRRITAALPLENVFCGPHTARYEVRADDLLEADRRARGQGLRVVGIYHSHPDAEAYFSETDLRHSWPFYAFVVLSIRAGVFERARCWLPDQRQTAAEEDDLQWM